MLLALKNIIVVTSLLLGALELAGCRTRAVPRLQEPPLAFMGVPEDQEITTTLNGQDGIPKMTAVEVVDYQTYLDLSQKTLEAEEVRGKWIYFAVSQMRDVAFANGRASVWVIMRYKARRPAGAARAQQ
jgi:hypothetical protein